MSRFRASSLCLLALFAACAHPTPAPQPTVPQPVPASAPAKSPEAPRAKKRVIVMVWDGLRPDSIDPALTPQLARLRDERGVEFQEHHSVYPTFTMMNAAALATGTRSAHHGFYGNTEYQPGPTGKNAKGRDIDFTQPIFTEDHGVLLALDAFYRAQGHGLFRVQSLFEAAHAAGLSTAVLGKGGPAFLLDYRQRGAIVDDNVVFPRSLALSLQAAGMALPKNLAHQSFPEGDVPLAADNGDPTAATPPVHVTLADGKTPDPRASTGSPHNQRNAYFMRVFIEHVLPQQDPALSLIWLRNPDATQHTYGPGTPNVRDALAHQDKLLGELLTALDKLGRSGSTDVLVVSDHGHSTVGSDSKLFPQRALEGPADGKAKVGKPQSPGYIVSGDVRTVDVLRRAGFKHVYDGMGCTLDPVLSGIQADGTPVYPVRKDASCGDEPAHCTASAGVPAAPLPEDAIVVAANGGSEYFYVPSGDVALVSRLVTALQERSAYGAMFVRERYASLPGTLPLARVGLEGPKSVSPPTPDLVVSFSWDENATSAAAPGVKGTEHSTALGYRGMHGSFSPLDVHNTLIAVGPSFRAGFRDGYPSSNLDVAPTVAALLGLQLPEAEGRVLDEAFAAAGEMTYKVEPFEERAGPVPLKKVCEPDDPDCKRPRRGGSYGFSLHGRVLSTADGRSSYRYLDVARASRDAR